MRSDNWIDISSGGFGLGMALVIFFAQGPYDHVWQYMFVAAPVLVASLFIGAHIAQRRFGKLRRALSRARILYELLNGTDEDTSVVVRIINTDGDVSVHRRSRLRLVKDGVSVTNTTKSFIGSEKEVPDLPPTAKIVTASNVNQAIRGSTVSIVDPGSANAGDIKFAYEWRYDLDPPLRDKGSFVEYEYSLIVPRAAALAFSDEGSEVNFSHTAVSSNVDCTLISCEGHSIEILECFSQESEGNRSPLDPAEAPVLKASGHVLSWKPAYRKGALFVCRYKVVPQ